MKKKIIIILLLVVPFISILFIIFFRGILMPSNEDIIEGLKNIKAYEAKVQYVMKNDKGEETEETKQWYSADKGVRVEFGDEVTKVYKDEKIYVKDTINNNEYELGQDMDIVHPLAFINNILAYPIREGSISEGQEEWGDTIYIKADVELFLNNIYFNKATIFIDKKNRVPKGKEEKEIPVPGEGECRAGSGSGGIASGAAGKTAPAGAYPPYRGADSHNGQ